MLLEEDECARTPLFYCRSAEICECLLKYGAEVDHVNDEGRSALMGTSDIDILKVLIDYGAALHSCFNDITAQVLIRAGAEGDALDRQGRTP